jgi:hypothetical protein
MVYDRILIAKHSPANKCFAADEDVLFFLPLKTIPLRGVVSHQFVSVQNSRVKSKYGWVKCVEPFSIGDFVRNNFGKPLDQINLSALKVMLDSISKLPEHTAVSIQYMQRGIEQKRMDISIHKVFFYNSNKFERSDI